MEQNIVIYIGVFKALSIIVTVIGGVAWGAWYASSRLTRVETKVDGFDTRLTNLEGRLDNAFGSTSPISLKPVGSKALEDSGLKKWIDDNKDILLSSCKTENAMKNQYDIQESAFKFFDQLSLGDFEEKLKKSAFSHGWSIETMRRIGGIYFRDLCLKEAGFKPDDLDKPKTA